MAWYETGYDIIGREEDRQAANQIPNSFWLKPGEGNKKPIIFLDDDPASFSEHAFKIKGEKFPSPRTCIRPMYPEDPVCCIELGPMNAYPVGYYTIINCSSFIDKKGTKRQYEIELLQAKMRTLKKLKARKQSKTSLVGLVFMVTRTDDKSPRCGDDFDVDREVKSMDELFPLVMYKGKKLSAIFAEANAAGPEAIAKLGKTFQLQLDPKTGKILPQLVPFNYEEIFKPKDPRTMRELLRARIVDATTDFGGTGPGMKAEDDDIPF